MKSLSNRRWQVRLKILSFLFATFLFGGLYLEISLRHYLLKPPFHYIEIYNGSPFFHLIKDYSGNKLTIQNGRRELASRGNRKHRIAFVGDSVTFCADLPDEVCFTEILQNRQQRYDVYNYGVPGYGLPEIEKTLEKLTKERLFDFVFYTMNMNDFFDAMPVLLTLLQSPDNRFSSLNEYEGLYGKAKLFVRDHYKTPFVLQYLTAFYPVTPLRINRSLEPTPPNQSCFARQSLLASQDYFVIKTEEGLSRMFKDQEFLLKLKEKLVRLNEITISRLVVLPLPTFSQVATKNNATHLLLTALMDSLEIDHIDIFKNLSSRIETCDFYLSHSHFGKRGNEFLAETYSNYLAVEAPTFRYSSYR